MAKEQKSDWYTNAVFEAMMMGVMIVALAPTLQKVLGTQYQSQYYQSQLYQGNTMFVRLGQTDGELMWIDLKNTPPYSPWFEVTVINNGPNRMFVGFNSSQKMNELSAGERVVERYAGAARRLEMIYYQTDISKPATADVEGKY